MRNSASAGHRPRGQRSSPSRQGRSRAPRPRKGTSPEIERRRHNTTLTARAAVLAVAVASVALAVALPFKIWLGQRNDIASLATQTKAAQQQVNQLTAANKRWQDPAYVEQQAEQRLHYAVPGKKSYVVLGAPRKPQHTVPQHAGSTAPWYSQLWQSVQAAGK